jgi:hypothetical protein
MLMSYALFWDVTRRRVVIVYHTTPRNIPEERSVCMTPVIDMNTERQLASFNTAAMYFALYMPTVPPVSPVLLVGVWTPWTNVLPHSILILIS